MFKEKVQRKAQSFPALEIGVSIISSILVTKQEEPYEGRLSRTVLWEREGEIPLRDSIVCHAKKKPTHIQAHLVFADTQANAEKPKELEFLPTLTKERRIKNLK